MTLRPGSQIQLNGMAIIMSQVVLDGGGSRLDTWLFILYDRKQKVYYLEVIDVPPIPDIHLGEGRTYERQPKMKSSPYTSLEAAIKGFWIKKREIENG